MKVNNITGSPVEGANFYGREKELDFAWSQISKGNSLILSAPRRVGKSSFAKKLLDKAKTKGWNTLELNLEEVKSEDGFIKLFIEKLEETSWWQKSLAKAGSLLGGILENLKPNIEYGGATLSLEWKNNKTDIYSKLKNLLDHNEQTLIMVDELTILLNGLLKNKDGINDVEFFLNWLRSFRQTSGTKIKWIFCSSIGIDNFTNLHNLSYALNDVDSFPIDEFNHDEAVKFIKKLADSESLNFTDEHIAYTLEKLGWNLPYFIQILFSNIDQFVKIQGKDISEETINEAYLRLINEKHLNTWDERLNEYGDYEIYSRLVLKNLSKIKEGENRANLFNVLYAKIEDEEKTEQVLNKLLYMLRNDGYIIDTKELKYAFRSPLLRDFWYNRFVR